MTTAVQDKIQTKLCAWNNYCIIRLEDAEYFTVAGLLVPHANGRAQVHGRVISVGPDAVEDIQAGDIALIPPWGVGLELTWQRVKYKILLDHEVLGVWRAQS